MSQDTSVLRVNNAARIAVAQSAQELPPCRLSDLFDGFADVWASVRDGERQAKGRDATAAIVRLHTGHSERDGASERGGLKSYSGALWVCGTSQEVRRGRCCIRCSPVQLTSARSTDKCH